MKAYLQSASRHCGAPDYASCTPQTGKHHVHHEQFQRKAAETSPTQTGRMSQSETRIPTRTGMQVPIGDSYFSSE